MSKNASAVAPTSARNPRFGFLFEPVKTGPVSTKTTFHQVPHFNGRGGPYPSARTQMRRVRAGGGRGVVCTERVEIHPAAARARVMGARDAVPPVTRQAVRSRYLAALNRSPADGQFTLWELNHDT